MHDKYSYKPVKKINRGSYKKSFSYSYKPSKSNKKTNTKLKVISIVSVPIFLLGAAAKISDKRVDHTEKLCQFTSLCYDLGLDDLAKDHQLKEIRKTGVDAYYQKGRIDKYYRKSTVITIRDGYYAYEERQIPEGYELLEEPFHGKDCCKTVEIPEAIIIEEKSGQARQLLLKK